MTSDTRITVRTSDLASQELDDEVVILDLRSSSYLLLNRTGATLWPALQTGATLAQLAQLLVEHFKVSDDVARHDAEAFVAALRSRDLLDE